MKIRAGWKLKGRKPRHSPSAITATRIEGLSKPSRPAVNSLWSYSTNAPEAMAMMPAARPSSPSMRLTAVVIAKTHSTTSSGFQSAESTTVPAKGMRK